MPSPPTINCDELLAPIAGPNPAGEKIAVLDFRDKYKELVREHNPEEYKNDDPKSKEPLKKADWPAAIRLAQETLLKKTKDVEVAARLVVSLTQVHHFGGLRDGLRFLSLLAERCWDRLNPPIDGDNDASDRGDKIDEILGSADGRTPFPPSLRRVPLLPNKPFGAAHIQGRPEDRLDVKPDDVHQAILAAPVADCQNAADDIEQALAELSNLLKQFDVRMNGRGPGLVKLREALESCRESAREVLKRKGVGQKPPNDGAVKDSKTNEAKPAPPAPAETRQGAYDQLAQAAAILQRLEPHSPIPHLVLWAVELGKMRYPELMKALIQDGNVIKDLFRRLGIAETPAGK